LFLKIGQLLVIENRLFAPADVFYLHFDELSKPDDFKEIVEKRKLEEKEMKKTPAYTRMVFSDKKIEPCVTNTIRLNSENSLCGMPTSMGCVRGQVLIVEEPNPSINTTGKILVTKSTDPGWVFLMKNAIGIISEKGSLLSHTAIIARELQKPAIVNVKDCTQILQNNDWVELNADTGIIHIIKEEAE
jgi:pyruvate,water dikinase